MSIGDHTCQVVGDARIEDLDLGDIVNSLGGGLGDNRSPEEGPIESAIPCNPGQATFTLDASPLAWSGRW